MMLHKKRPAYFLASLLVSLHLPTQALAEECKAKLDTPEIRAELGIGNDWMPNAEETIAGWLRNKIVREAKTHYEDGKFQETLDALKRANDLCPGESSDALTAKCLAHLHRRDDALAFISKLSESDWATRVEVYETLGLDDKAMQLCDQAPDYSEAMLLKIKLLRKQGKPELAIETAERERCHRLRMLYETDKFDAVLNELGVNQLQEPPRITELNSAVFKLLAKLINLKQPRTSEQLESIFHRPFSVGGTIIPNTKFPTLSCTPSLDGPLVAVGLTHDALLGKDENILCISLNLDRTFLTQQQIAQFLLKHGIASIKEHIPEPMFIDHGTVRNDTGLELLCECKDSKIQLVFLKTGQLTAINKYWKKSPAELEERRLRNMPHKFTDDELVEAADEIAKANYAQAVRGLLQRFVYYDWELPTEQLRYDAACKTRALLIRCYEGLKQDGVARYLKEAPLQHILGHANYGLHDPATCFPTYSEYMARLWPVYGPADSKLEGEYHISVNNLFQTDIFSKSPRYASVFERLGPITGNETKRITPLPGSIVDEEFLHPNFQR